MIDGIPILLSPEMWLAEGASSEEAGTDPHHQRYAEAYEEMSFYTAWTGVGDDSLARAEKSLRLRMNVQDDRAAPQWAPVRGQRGGNTAGAVAAAYQHLGPFAAPGAFVTCLQIGGRGTHALNFLVAGADRATLVSPVLAELQFSRELAASVGLDHRLDVVCGIAEELPFADAVFDRVYSGSSIHHTVTAESFPEISRVMAGGARFASVDIWRAPLYNIGVKLFGRATPGIRCKPMDEARLEPARGSFDDVSITMHGALARYPLAVLSRMGAKPSAAWARRLAEAEDSLAQRFDIVARQASLVLVRGAVDRDDATVESSASCA